MRYIETGGLLCFVLHFYFFESCNALSTQQMKKDKTKNPSTYILGVHSRLLPELLDREVSTWLAVPPSFFLPSPHQLFLRPQVPVDGGCHPDSYLMGMDREGRSSHCVTLGKRPHLSEPQENGVIRVPASTGCGEA